MPCRHRTLVEVLREQKSQIHHDIHVQSNKKGDGRGGKSGIARFDIAPKINAVGLELTYICGHGMNGEDHVKCECMPDEYRGAKVLYLSRNELRNVHGIASAFGQVSVVSLVDNCLSSLDDCRELGQLPCLRKLSLEGNPVVHRLPNYRYRMLHLCRGSVLERLDGRAVGSREKEKAAEVCGVEDCLMSVIASVEVLCSLLQDTWNDFKSAEQGGITCDAARDNSTTGVCDLSTQIVQACGKFLDMDIGNSHEYPLGYFGIEKGDTNFSWVAGCRNLFDDDLVLEAWVRSKNQKSGGPCWNETLASILGQYVDRLIHVLREFHKEQRAQGEVLELIFEKLDVLGHELEYYYSQTQSAVVGIEEGNLEATRLGCQGILGAIDVFCRNVIQTVEMVEQASNIAARQENDDSLHSNECDPKVFQVELEEMRHAMEEKERILLHEIETRENLEMELLEVRQELIRASKEASEEHENALKVQAWLVTKNESLEEMQRMHKELETSSNQTIGKLIEQLQQTLEERDAARRDLAQAERKISVPPQIKLDIRVVNPDNEDIIREQEVALKDLSDKVHQNTKRLKALERSEKAWERWQRIHDKDQKRLKHAFVYWRNMSVQEHNLQKLKSLRDKISLKNTFFIFRKAVKLSARVEMARAKQNWRVGKSVFRAWKQRCVQMRAVDAFLHRKGNTLKRKTFESIKNWMKYQQALVESDPGAQKAAADCYATSLLQTCTIAWSRYSQNCHHLYSQNSLQLQEQMSCRILRECLHHWRTQAIECHAERVGDLAGNTIYEHRIKHLVLWALSKNRRVSITLRVAYNNLTRLNASWKLSQALDAWKDYHSTIAASVKEQNNHMMRHLILKWLRYCNLKKKKIEAKSMLKRKQLQTAKKLLLSWKSTAVQELRDASQSLLYFALIRNIRHNERYMFTFWRYYVQYRKVECLNDKVNEKQLQLDHMQKLEQHIHQMQQQELRKESTYEHTVRTLRSQMKEMKQIRDALIIHALHSAQLRHGLVMEKAAAHMYHSKETKHLDETIKNLQSAILEQKSHVKTLKLRLDAEAAMKKAAQTRATAAESQVSALIKTIPQANVDTVLRHRSQHMGKENVCVLLP